MGIHGVLYGVKNLASHSPYAVHVPYDEDMPDLVGNDVDFEDPRVPFERFGGAGTN